MGPRIATAGVVLAVVLLAGCGGKTTSSTPPPKGGVVAGNWQIVSQGRHWLGSTTAKATATATNPLRLRLRVTSIPDVSTSTTYEVQCGTDTSFGKALAGHTPVTRELTIPAGGGSNAAHGQECFVIGSATKPAKADMTVTLEERPVPPK